MTGIIDEALTGTDKLVSGLSLGDKWSCSINVYDGTSWSGWINSSKVTVITPGTTPQDSEEDKPKTTTCSESNITRTELPTGGYTYKFKLKPSDCKENGVCYVALVVVDDSKVIQEYKKSTITQ
jgi:hypothetical protein